MSYVIEEKNISPTLVLTHQGGCTLAGLKQTAFSLFEKADKNAKGSVFCLVEQPAMKFDSKLQVCCPIKHSNIPLDETKMKFQVLQRTKVVTTVHTGSYDKLEEAFQSLYQYVEENNLKITTPYRVIYHKEKRERERSGLFRRSEKKYVTEIQIPLMEEES